MPNTKPPDKPIVETPTYKGPDRRGELRNGTTQASAMATAETSTQEVERIAVIYSGPRGATYGEREIPVGEPFEMSPLDAASMVRARPEFYRFENEARALETIRFLAEEQRRLDEEARANAASPPVIDVPTTTPDMTADDRRSAVERALKGE